jgi:WD40 repeat protein
VHAILRRDWVTVLAGLAVVGILRSAGSSQHGPAHQVVLNAAAGKVRALAFADGGELLAATAADGIIQPWKLEPDHDRARRAGPTLPGFHAVFSPGGTTLAVGGDANIAVWEAGKVAPRQRLWTIAGSTVALALSRDGGTLALADNQGVTFWDTASARRRECLNSPPCAATSLAFAPDGRSLATGDRDGFVRIWDLRTGRERVAVRVHGFHVTLLRFSDTGRTLLSASHAEYSARLCDVATGCVLESPKGHSGLVQSADFAPGGRTVATGASDGTVRLWDRATGRDVAMLHCDGFVPLVMAFSADGRTLAAGGIEPRVCLWVLAESGTTGPASGESW